MKPLSPEAALQRAASRCAQQECCLHDVRQALIRWGIEEQKAENILTKLETEGYIDEGRYARAFAHDKIHYDRWGKLKIQAALRQKHISESDIRTALSETDEELYVHNLQAVLAAKRRTLAESETPNTREKLARHALSKGYEAGLVFKELDNE